MLAAGERLRAQLESDPTRHLGAELTGRLETQSALAARALGLDADRTALCANATSGAAAIIASLPLSSADTVVTLDTEYSSIQRAWQIACARAAARLITIPVALPFHSPDQLLADLDASVPNEVTYLQASLISSSAAIQFPVTVLADWVRGRGGELILDAAHGPGHIPLTPTEWNAAAVFGTLHKWLPTLRPVGFLSLAPHMLDRVRPAEVSLTWDAGNLVERFSWPGTFDPVPRLCLDTALTQWSRWYAGGDFDECRRLADTASDALARIGARPTATAKYSPPRMRSFILDAVTVTEVVTALQSARLRAWVGPGASGECLLRIATHVYNDQHDIDALTNQIQEVLSR
ncbi:aminotransferase class V-fold PLP-dependent enzyme [Nocardia asteroides]